LKTVLIGSTLTDLCIISVLSYVCKLNMNLSSCSWITTKGNILVSVMNLNPDTTYVLMCDLGKLLTGRKMVICVIPLIYKHILKKKKKAKLPSYDKWRIVLHGLPGSHNSNSFNSVHLLLQCYLSLGWLYTWNSKCIFGWAFTVLFERRAKKGFYYSFPDRF
jgi:hypothetical protein